MKVPVDRGTVITTLKTLALFAAASALQTALTCGWRSNSLYCGRVFLFTFFLWVLLWGGNSMLTDYVSAKVPWIAYPLKRFVIGFVTTILYTLSAVLLVLFLFQGRALFNLGSSAKFTVGISIGVTILISLFLHSREFLLHWRAATLEEEQFKRQRVAARYDRLKSKINPQLLFNSLNALEPLIQHDKEKAVKFIKKLSDVYRYTLESRDRELVPLVDEFRILRSYAFLLEAQSGKVFGVSIPDAEPVFHVPPLSLQLVLSTVVAHARRDDNHLARVSFSLAGSFVVVEARFFAVDDHAKNSLATILNEMEEQYRFLSVEPMRYELSNERLFARLPLLNEFDSQDDNA